jgi:hypothetical protein
LSEIGKAAMLWAHAAGARNKTLAASSLCLIITYEGCNYNKECGSMGPSSLQCIVNIGIASACEAIEYIG